MKVALAVLADYANISREGKLNILGIFDMIQASAFPVTHPQMQLVMRFEADLWETASKKKFDIQLIDEVGKKLLGLGGSLAIGRGQEGALISTNQILTINMLKFERPGSYEFKILVDDEVKAQVPLRVVETGGPSP